MDYANPIYATYSVAGVDFTGAAATDLNIVGPAGCKGIVVAVGLVITTGITVAASTVIVGTAADTDAYASMAAPIAAANAVYNNPTITSVDTALIPADTRVLIGNGGGSTAGVGTVTVTIAWFK